MEVLRLSTDLNIRQKLDYSMNIIGNISMIFRFGDPELKNKLLGSIFPEKIYFDEKNIEPPGSIIYSVLSSTKPRTYKDRKNGISRTL